MVDSFTQHTEKGYCELSLVANNVIIYEPNDMQTGLICIGTIKSPISLRIRVVSLPLTSAAITIELMVNYPNHLIPWQVSHRMVQVLYKLVKLNPTSNLNEEGRLKLE